MSIEEQEQQACCSTAQQRDVRCLSIYMQRLLARLPHLQRAVPPRAI